MARSSISAFGGITKCRWSGSVGDEQPSSIGGHSLAGVVVVECDNDGCLPGLRHRDGRGTLVISHFREDLFDAEAWTDSARLLRSGKWLTPSLDCISPSSTDSRLRLDRRARSVRTTNQQLTAQHVNSRTICTHIHARKRCGRGHCVEGCDWS